MVYRTFNARRNQTYGVTVSLVAPYPAAVMYGKLGDFPNETDHEFRKEFTRDDFMARTAPPHEDVHTAYTILQPDAAGDNGTGEYTVGLRVDGCPPSGCLYSVDVARLACVFWDPGMDAELGSWKGDGCRVSPASTLTHTLCLCNHLTAFGTSARTEPNKIHFNTVFTKFDELVNNYAVWTTMVVTMGLYLFMLYPARREDMKDQRKWKIKNVHGNRKNDRYRYLMRVDTGHDWGAGTRSKVSFQLTGDEGSTGPRAFQQDGVTFQSGSVDTFLLTSPEPVGEPGSLAVWHDNSGQGRHASWCLERVEVIDLQTFKRTLFVCDSWLGVEHGDGCLRRTMPPTAETDVSLGQRFSLKLREKFKDGHVWLSVVTSRARSYFSRVQRLSCCLCLLYCKMVTSAMWFRGTEQGTSSAVVSIGPVELTEDTLWVSLMTTLQVFPINFIIAQIFGRRRPKGAPKSSGAKLPYWFLYVGWALLVLATLASGFFLLLYSMEWGSDKSIQWLTAFGLSFLQSMVVVQPAQTLPDCPRIAWSEQEETDQLKQQRAVRKGWLQLTHNGKQCMLGIIIIAAALLMVHETWSPAVAGVNQGLKDSFSDGINEIQTQYDVLPWMEGTLARKLYRTQHYNGEELGWEDRVFITDMPAYRLGPARLGQFRALSANCDVQAKFLNKSYKTCVKSYGGVAGEAAASFPESKPVTSFGRTVHGTRGSYGGPGYSVSLGETEAEMMEALKVLKANRWIDRYTAALVLDLSLYHVNANLFSTVSVLFEFPPSAGAIASLHVSTFPLASPGIAPTILLVAKAVFTVSLVVVAVRVVKMARQEGASFLLQVWTIVDVASVVMSIYIIVATVFKDVLAGKAKALISQQLAKDNRTFVDLFGVAFWSDQFTTAAAMVIWFNLVKICSLLRVSSRVRTYLDVLIKIRMKLLGSFIIFLLIVTGFSMSGHLLFCPYVAGFRSLSRATASLAFIPWEEISYDALVTANETVGPLFLFVANFTILYLLLSFTAAVFVSVTSGLRGTEGRGRVAAAQQRKKRLAQAAKETRNAAPRRNVAPTVRNTRHYCNCDETNECYGQVHSTETQV
ncbi:PREDICTED: polycystic kidney disease protein 1-like 2 [Branchiostoma belcheri]|uniref:Polycystic kidney disease protein 1-like 2 n=1 Tax=Branchiostoma belcheri TaxID=7741 RepID=A0A6P4Z0Y8_BRABE|nr:PREDICTED: polycystic kidney disease protein 1-like 2 [Branchiostoma belcheri]